MKKSLYLFSSLFLCAFLACHPVKTIVKAGLETTPVESSDDAADDPAIFVHPQELDKSAIIGTNKQSGLVVYNMSGEAVHTLNVGRINNVDLRHKVKVGEDRQIVLVGGTNRSDNSISLFELHPNTLQLSNIAARKLYSSVDEVYGFCFYQKEKTYAFLVGKDGQVEQWELFATTEGKVDGKVVRTFDVGGQCEGLVADDEQQLLYIAEEAIGIWKYSASPNGGSERIFIDGVKQNKMLKADIEGLTLYIAANGAGYLIASSQGNNSYAIYERQGDNRYIGSFKIGAGESIDGSSETDGIDIINRPINAQFPSGFLIVQDGDNRYQKSKQNQNFKLVAWEQIAHSFSQPLLIDKEYQVQY